MSEVSTETAVVTGDEVRAVEVDAVKVEPAPQRRVSSSRISLVLVVSVVLLALSAGLVSSSLTDTPFQHDFGWVAAAAIFASSYVALAIGRIPGLALDRAGIALVGAALMVACGALTLDEAYKAIDLDTVTLLLGMMIVVANLRLSGVLSLATIWVGRRAHGPS
jgi:di/tricarboxylate transporter